MKKIKSLSFIALLLATLFTLGCSKDKKSAWNTDIDAAKSFAKKHKQNILLVISGEDWDGKTTALKTNIFEAEDFKTIESAYTLLRIDFSQQEYSKAFLKEDATDEEKAEAEKIIQKYERMEQLATAYNIETYPSIYILSKEGFFLATVPYTEEIKSVSDLTSAIEAQNETITSISTLISEMQKASGTDKAKAIDDIFEVTPPEYRAPLEPLVKEIASLDADNTTSLLGKYEMWEAYINVQKAMTKATDAHSAVKPLIDIAESTTSHLTPDEKQEAYYTATYLLAQLGTRDFDYLYTLLEKAKNASPQSEHLAYIDRMKQALDLAVKEINLQENANE